MASNSSVYYWGTSHTFSSKKMRRCISSGAIAGGGGLVQCCDAERVRIALCLVAADASASHLLYQRASQQRPQFNPRKVLPQ